MRWESEGWLSRMKPKPVWEANGFTLVEVLIVIAIVGILAAIAIPQMAAYRRRSLDSQVQYDIKNAAIAQEAYFVDMRTYAGSVVELSGNRGFRQNTNVNIAVAGTTGGFVITGSAISGCSPSTGTWSVNSVAGQIVGTPCD